MNKIITYISPIILALVTTFCSPEKPKTNHTKCSDQYEVKKNSISSYLNLVGYKHDSISYELFDFQTDSLTYINVLKFDIKLNNYINNKNIHYYLMENLSLKISNIENCSKNVAFNFNVPFENNAYIYDASIPNRDSVLHSNKLFVAFIDTLLINNFHNEVTYLDTLLSDLNSRIKAQDKREYTYGFCDLIKKIDSPVDSISNHYLKVLGSVSVLTVAFESPASVKKVIDFAYDAIDEERNDWEQIRINLDE